MSELDIDPKIDSSSLKLVLAFFEDDEGVTNCKSARASVITYAQGITQDALLQGEISKDKYTAMQSLLDLTMRCVSHVEIYTKNEPLTSYGRAGGRIEPEGLAYVPDDEYE